MPKDSAGNFRMNAQIARSPVGGKKSAAPATDPTTDPTADSGQEKSVTITQQADGTYSYSDSEGQTQAAPDFQSAMSMAQQCFGESGDGDQDDQGAGAAAGADQSAGGGNAGAMGY